ncbi:SDR family NAD(P)-dependent oxidoreductase [Nocardia sp. NPDC002869]|uniref:SDR family NAD(P)-dependent oxidoreductase n=1 Tax=Nocardia sp. NPDC002869 TaxID=3161032 RepID=UPI00398CC81D
MFTRTSIAPLAGRTVVVTGAGSGIGRALALRLSANGSPVALLDVDADGLAGTVAELAGPHLAAHIDVTDRKAQADFAARVTDWSPAPIGAVVNNAGVMVAAPFTPDGAADDDWVLRINLDGVVNGTRAWLPLLLKQGSGAIVNVSSMFGLAARPYHGAYCTSKFGVRGLTETLRHELAGTGVRAVAVHPGYIKTGIVAHGRTRDLGRSHEQFVTEFASFAPTTADRAAEVIHRGIDAGRSRILIGPDAYAFDIVSRITPSHYGPVLDRVERLMDWVSRRRK